MLREHGVGDTVTSGKAHMMLQVAPTNWYSWDFTVSQASKRVAAVDVSGWWQKGELTIEGAKYDVYRESWTGPYVLERNGSVIARAEKPSAFFRRYLVRYLDREYTLEAQSHFRRAFVVLEGTRQIGSIEPTCAFKRNAKADLPEGWPLAVRAFVIWLTMIQWRQSSHG